MTVFSLEFETLDNAGAFMKIKKISKVNPVAKASRNKPGAGAHKSKKEK
jgi:hypothetical protein